MANAAVGRALAATAAMTLGFLAVFGSFGLLTVAVASAVQRHLPYATLAVRAALIAAGIWLLAGRTLPGLNSTPLLRSSSRWVPTARLGSMVGYGAGYAIASLTCTIGPFLAVTGSSLRSGSALTTVLVYVAYALGLALVVGVLAVAVALASATMVERTRRILPYVNRISGLVLILVGLYVAYYGWFELRLFVAPAAPPTRDRRRGTGSACAGGLGVPQRGVAVAADVGGTGRPGGIQPRRTPASPSSVSGHRGYDSSYVDSQPQVGSCLVRRRRGGSLGRRRTGRHRHHRAQRRPGPTSVRRRDAASRSAAAPACPTSWPHTLFPGRLRADHPERQRLRGLERALGQRERLQLKARTARNPRSRCPAGFLCLPTSCQPRTTGPGRTGRCPSPSPTPRRSR